MANENGMLVEGSAPTHAISQGFWEIVIIRTLELDDHLGEGSLIQNERKTLKKDNERLKVIS